MVCLVGYGPTAPELKVLCSTDWATGTLLYTLMIYSYKKLVLTVGFEPTRNYPLDPKTSVAAITPREHIYKSLWLASHTFLAPSWFVLKCTNHLVQKIDAAKNNQKISHYFWLLHWTASLMHKLSNGASLYFPSFINTLDYVDMVPVTGLEPVRHKVMEF